jgi:hypothetical protein
MHAVSINFLGISHTFFAYKKNLKFQEKSSKKSYAVQHMQGLIVVASRFIWKFYSELENKKFECESVSMG